MNNFIKRVEGESVEGVGFTIVAEVQPSWLNIIRLI